MLARQYSKLIEIWEQTYSPDGYGGNIPAEKLVKKIYAKVKTGAGYKFQQLGLTELKNPVTFSVRGSKNGININLQNIVKYNGQSFFIKSIEPVGLDGLELNLLCDGH